MILTSQIEPTIQFILDELHQDSELVTLCDNQFYTGLLRTPVTLVAPHYTRVGILYTSDSGDGCFFTQVRDFDKLDINIVINVVCGLGENDNHCRKVVDTIANLFSLHRKKVTEDYKIYINKISTKIESTEQAHWVGTITMDVEYYFPVPDIQ